MKQFSALVQVLGTSTKTNDKLQALSTYFQEAGNNDKIWVIALFSGRRPKRIINSAKLAEWCCEITELPYWLFEESYHTVGDLGETIALLLPEIKVENLLHENNLTWYLGKLIELEKAEETIKKAFIVDCWMQMTKEERFVFNKLLTGGFRIGISQKMMVNALAKRVKADPSVIANRISGKWEPSKTKTRRGRAVRVSEGFQKLARVYHRPDPDITPGGRYTRRPCSTGPPATCLEALRLPLRPPAGADRAGAPA